MRINKYIAETGLCSRREAENYINEKRVCINGEPAFLYSDVQENDIVTLDGIIIKRKIEKIYILFNKPKGITVTTERHILGNIIDYIHYPERIFPIGRLDKDSRGLIVLTNDGDVINKALRSENNHSKEYVVTVNKAISPAFLRQMAAGVIIFNPVSGQKVQTKKCQIHKIDEKTFKIVLTQGYNRQIRRMCQALGYEVKDLCRIRFMNLEDFKLPEGQWRLFTKEEKKTFLNSLK